MDDAKPAENFWKPRFESAAEATSWAQELEAASPGMGQYRQAREQLETADFDTKPELRDKIKSITADFSDDEWLALTVLDGINLPPAQVRDMVHGKSEGERPQLEPVDWVPDPNHPGVFIAKDELPGIGH